jgi:hypothetical protein
LCLAQLCEPLLKTYRISACVRISCGNRATDTGIAAFEGDFAEFETDDAAKLRGEELVFPEGRYAVEFECGPETQAGFGDGEGGEPVADGVERSGGDDGGAVGDEVIGNAGRIVADHYRLIEKFAEPCRGYGRFAWKCEGSVGDFAGIIGCAQSDAGEIGSVRGANQVHSGGTGGADNASVERTDGPGAVEFKPPGGADGCGLDFDGVEGFNGMDLDSGQAWIDGCWAVRVHS